MKRRLRRLAALFAAIAAVLAVVVLTSGLIYEFVGRRNAARDFPVAGKLVDIGGRRIQLDCRGAGSPTVVFEDGLNFEGSLSWSAVHDSIATTTRACAYSRAGLMWSDPRDGAHTGRVVAEDLHETLAKGGETAPFVLVGHSLGGPYSMIYAHYFDSEVAGVVLVDASHPDQVMRLAAITPAPDMRKILTVYKVVAALRWTGIARALTSKMVSTDRPTGVYPATAAFSSKSLAAYVHEFESLNRTFAEASPFRQLGDRPLYVLTHTKPMNDAQLEAERLTAEQGVDVDAIWLSMQNDMTTWSTRSQHQLVPNASHDMQFDRPDVVIAAVRSVVDSVRARPELR